MAKKGEPNPDARVGPLDISEFWNAVLALDVAAAIKKWSSLETRVDDLSASSDIGNARSNNEDAHLAWKFRPAGESRWVTALIVADGVGGDEAGEVASNILVKTAAVDLFRMAFRRSVRSAAPEDIGLMADTVNTDDLALNSPWTLKSADLADSIRLGHDRILMEADRRGMPDGMSTTAVIAVLSDRTIHVAHVGDSRAYVFGKEGLRRITTDHSLVADLIRQNRITADEARRHPMRHVILRSVGNPDGVDPETGTEKLWPNDAVLLCTDGLTDMLDDPSIEAVLRRTPLVSDQVRELIHDTLQAGGRDNTTVALARPSPRPILPPPGANEAVLVVCQFGRAITYRIHI